MYKLLISFIILLMISCKGYRSNGCKEISKYLATTRQMTENKNYETALIRFIWYYHHAEEKCSSHGPSRLSFGLSYFKELADVYPPALTVMKRLRDSTTHLFILGSGNYNAFREVNALNDKLGDKKRTVELFEMIDKRDPQLANRCWPFIKDELFDDKRYDLISKYLKDPLDEYEETISWYKMDQASDVHIPVADSATREIFIKDCCNLIGYCVFTQDISKGKEIQQKALKVVDDARIRDAIGVK